MKLNRKEEGNKNTREANKNKENCFNKLQQSNKEED